MKSESQNQKRKLSLTNALVISIIVLALLGGAMLFFVVNTVIRGIMHDRLISISERDVAINAYEVDAWFLRYSNFVEHMATTWETVGVVPGETGFGPDPIGASFLAESDALVGVFVGFENGWHVNSSGWIPPDGFDASTRPWYLVPEAAGGEVAITLPYVRLLDGDIVASMGVWRPDIIGMEAVVAVDIRLQYVLDMLAALTAAADGFFMLVGPDGEIIVHGQTDYMLTPYQEAWNLRDVHQGEMLMQSIQSGEPVFYDHHIFGSVYFFSTPLSMVNWTLGAIIPTASAEAQITEYLLIVMLVLLAFFIVFLIVSLSFAAKFFGRMKKKEVEDFEMTQLILNSAPLFVTIWDDERNLIEINNRTVEFFGIEGSEYENRFADLWAEIQPCGTPAIQKSMELAKQIMANGSMRYEWAYHLPNGEEVIFDVVGVRIERDGKTLILEYYQDLREIRAAQEKEREAEKFGRIIQDNSPILIEMWDTDYNFVDVNKKMMEVLGINSVEEFAADVWRFSPEFQPCGKTSEQVNTEIIDIAVKQGFARCEYNYLLPNGELLPTEITFVLVEFQAKKIVLMYAQDLRQIKEASKREHELEVKLQEQEMNERIRVMFDAAPIVIEYWSREYEPIDCNLTALNYYGLANKEEYSNRMSDFFEDEHPNTQQWRKNLDKIFQKGFGQFEFNDHKPNGEVTSLEVQAVRLKIENEDVVVTYAQDVTQIKESERAKLQALEKERETYELMSLLIESSPVFMEIWHDGQLVDCNEQCVKLFGIENKNEFITRYEDLSPPYQPCGTPSLEKAASIVQDTMRKGYTRTPWLHRNIKTGEEVPVEVIFVLLKPSDNRELIVGYNIDMRPIIKAQEEQKRSEIAEGANRAKSNFLARMSHEIRTPITAVMGISEIELQDPAIPPKTGESFAKIYNSASSLLAIVNDILDLSKIESGKMELTCSEYKVSHMILDISQIHLAFIDNKDIKFTVRVDENLPTHLVGDALRIVQITNNVLSNAFKYTLDGTVELSFACRQQKDEDTISLVISIRDSGFGMSEEQLQDLSNEYTRYHEHDYRLIDGTGLGMPIVFNLTKLMGADIKINSEVGVGTSVVIAIPQKQASKNVLGADNARRLEQLEESAKAKVMKLSTRAEPMPYGKVLIVDDVEANLFVAKGLMEFYDLTIETCSNGYDAINKVKQGNVYDIIFMDHMMPGINGTETMQQLREIGYTEPIVALTANAMIGQAEEFMSMGFDDFISKPIKTQNLHSALVKFIKDKQPPEVIETALAANANKPAPKINIESFQRNPKLLGELKAHFVKSHKNTISLLRQALDDGDIGTAHRLAHTIKSSAAMIYENTLSEAAKEVELVLAKNKQPTEAQMLTIKTELDRVLHSIGEPAANTPAAHVSLSPQEAITLLDKVEPLLTNRNTTCMAMLNDLRKIPQADLLCGQMEDYNFGDALETLEALRENLRDA
ncbi:MAG: response regulator [Oscillospiraceae bacterium]|nr:response regulator [Oscillospiraceae bacterium]